MHLIATNNMNLSPKSVFITGANRGIGLEFVKQFLRLPNPPKAVVATSRNPLEAKVHVCLTVSG